MVSEALAAAIRAALIDGQLPCPAAFEIAERLGVSPAEVGQAADELEVRVSRCQLGLFGYGPKAEGKHRIVQPMAAVPPELEEAIRARLRKGRLPCAYAWGIAKKQGRARMDVSSAAEKLQIKVSRCQLGCF